jgi:hypothetical protein
MSKFHLIWCLISQESSFGRKGSNFSQVMYVTGLQFTLSDLSGASTGLQFYLPNLSNPSTRLQNCLSDLSVPNNGL